MSATHVTQATFRAEVLDASQPVLVDFWATWCGPCRAIAPTLDLLAREFAGRAKVVKVDVDQSPHLAETYGVRSIPTLVLFRDGAEVERFVGARSAGELQRTLNAAVAAGQTA